MATRFEKYQKRKLISSYISVVVSIALVLFLLGSFGWIAWNAQRVSNHFKEQLTLTIFLEDTAKEVEVKQLTQSITLAPYAKSVQYVSKDEAAETHTAAIGEDFMNFLGYNPLQNSLDVHIKAEFVTPEGVEALALEIKEKDFVEDVVYDKPLLDILTQNIKRVGTIVLIACGLFLVIAVLLINSAIRLSIYAKRFTIKTMQMVGATKFFIRKPFILKSIRLGMWGAFLALLALSVLCYYADRYFPEFQILAQPIYLVILGSCIVLFGMLISGISTYLATQRFLNLTTDELYY